MPRKSRSIVRHAIPRILNARLFSGNFRSSLVRTDGTYIDLEDLFNLIFSPETAKRLLSTWRCKCSGGKLKTLISEKGGEFGSRMKPTDIVHLKWLDPEFLSPRAGRSRVVSSSVGMCVILNVIRTSRKNEELDSALDYFETLVRSNDSLDMLHYTTSSIQQSKVDSSVRALMALPHTPVFNWLLCENVLGSGQRLQADDASSMISDSMCSTQISSADTVTVLENTRNCVD